MSDDNKNIDDLIKGGFDDTNDDFNLDSWDDLANRMDQIDDLDGSIASAFNTPEEEVPSSVWSNVNDDLDIDTVWSRIDTALTKRKRRALIWWNAASIAFLILIIGGLLTKQPVDQLYTAETLNINKGKTQFVNSTTDEISDDLSNTPIEKNSNNLNSDEVNITLTKVEKSILQEAANELYKTENSPEQKKASNGIITVSNAIKKKSDNHSSFNISSLQPLMLAFNDPTLKSLIIRDTSTLNSASSDNNPSNVGLTDKPTKKWLIGIKGSVVNSKIIDGLSSEASSENSLVSNNFTVSFNPAIFAQYSLKNGYFLQSDLYLNYRVRRSINTYDQLEYVSRTTQLDYLRLNLKAGKSYDLTKFSDKMNLNIALGGYWDYLKSQQDFRGQTLVSMQKSYNTNNFGVASEIAIQHNINRLSFSYGTQFDIGLQNINQESTKLGSFNSARTFSYGLFFRLGYRL